MDRSISEAPPIACTLDTPDFKKRADWIADLNRAALLDARRDGLRLELTYRPQAFEDVHELVRREQLAAHSSTLIFVVTTTPSGSL